MLSLDTSSASKINAHKSGRDDTADDKVTDISDSIQRAKNSSLLYQVISKLLVKETVEGSTQWQSKFESASNNSNTVAIDSLAIESNQWSFNQDITTASISRVTWQLQDQQRQIETDQLNLTLKIIQRESSQTAISFINDEPQQADPLMLDLGAKGIITHGSTQGAYFDINNDGIKDRVSTSLEDAFLALDLNQNGLIDNAAELFGDQSGYANGFEALKVYDSNTDKVINAEDPIFYRLLSARLIGNEQFIQKLSDTTVSELSLSYKNTQQPISSGDKVVQIGEYKTIDGSRHDLVDVVLSFQAGNEKDPS